MARKTLCLIAILAVFATLSLDATPAAARGFGLFRSRSYSSPTYSNQRYSTQSRNVQSWTNGRKVYYNSPTNSRQYNMRNKWPGAIGAPSYRYKAFEEINGTWR